MKRLLAISMGIVLCQHMPYSGVHTIETTAIKALEDAPIASPAKITIKTERPSAQVQATIECTSAPDIETQTMEATTSDTGRATIHYTRVKGMSYTISLTVNGEIYTMKDETSYESTCDGLAIEGIRAGVDAEGMQTLTVTVSLADVPEAPEIPEAEPIPDPVEPENPEEPEAVEPEKPKPVEPSDEEEETTEQVQKVDKSSTIAQGMPTGCTPWSPVHWILSLFNPFRVCL